MPTETPLSAPSLGSPALGYRRLKAGEIVRTGDVRDEALGLEPVEADMIGEPVLGRRYGGPDDRIYRPRMRAKRGNNQTDRL